MNPTASNKEQQKMDRLWAPWRHGYIVRLNQDTHREDVITRMAQHPEEDEKNLVYLRTKHAFAVLNLFPYNNGHTLVCPLRRVADPRQLTRREKHALYDLVDEARDLLDVVLKPHGYNVGMNLGRVAGAGIPKHLHIHIVPRWEGDVNFMPVIASTRVVSQSLESLYQALIEARRAKRRARSTRTTTKRRKQSQS